MALKATFWETVLPAMARRSAVLDMLETAIVDDVWGGIWKMGGARWVR